MSRQITQKRVLIALAALLLVSSFLPGSLAFRLASRPRNALLYFLNPATDMLTRVSHKLRPAPLGPEQEDQEKIRHDRDRLIQYSRQLEQQLLEAHQLIDQLTRVARLPEMAGKTFIAAGVTAAPPGGVPSLVINRGSRDGLEAGWVVVNDMSIVGQLAEVGPVSSTVRLINVPKRVVGVRIIPPVAGPAGQGVIARATVSNNGEEFWAESTEAGKVKPGDLAHLDDSQFPAEARAFVVGRVDRVEASPRDPYLVRRIVIKPIEPYSRLAQVVVIKPPVYGEGPRPAPSR